MKKAAFWLCMLSVVVLSLLPTNYLPPPVFSIWDKAQHALAFATLGLLGLLAYSDRSRTKVLLGLLLLGAAIEVAQWATGWRYGEWLDLLADTVGLAVGFAAYQAWCAHRLNAPGNA